METMSEETSVSSISKCKHSKRKSLDKHQQSQDDMLSTCDNPVVSVDQLIDRNSFQVPDIRIDLTHCEPKGDSFHEDGPEYDDIQKRKRIKLSNPEDDLFEYYGTCKPLVNAEDEADKSTCSSCSLILNDDSLASDLLSQSSEMDSLALETLLASGTQDDLIESDAEASEREQAALLPFLLFYQTRDEAEDACALDSSLDVNISDSEEQDVDDVILNITGNSAQFSNPLEEQSLPEHRIANDELSSLAETSLLERTHDSLESLSLYSVSGESRSRISSTSSSGSYHSDQTVPSSSDEGQTTPRRRRQLNSCTVQVVPDIDYLIEE